MSPLLPAGNEVQVTPWGFAFEDIHDGAVIEAGFRHLVDIQFDDFTGHLNSITVEDAADFIKATIDGIANGDET